MLEYNFIMKSLSAPELESYCRWICSKIEHAQLQSVWSFGDAYLILQFYNHKDYWLLFDLNPASPQVILCEHSLPFKNEKKPASLFLNSHFKNKRIQNIDMKKNLGRVVEFNFSEGCIEFIAIPRKPNLIVHFQSKKISWNKPTEIQASQDMQPLNEVPDWSLRESEWRSEVLARGGSSKATVDHDYSRALDKKKSALEKIESSDADQEILKLQAKGQSLLHENPAEAEAYFLKAKAIKRKKIGTEQRVIQLKNEIEEIEKKINSNEFSSAAPESKSTSLQILKKADGDARTLRLPEGFEAVIGKSAKDNLSILRNSRSWDYWMHLRDYPSAHAILFRNKNQNAN